MSNSGIQPRSRLTGRTEWRYFVIDPFVPVKTDDHSDSNRATIE